MLFKVLVVDFQRVERGVERGEEMKIRFKKEPKILGECVCIALHRHEDNKHQYCYGTLVRENTRFNNKKIEYSP